MEGVPDESIEIILSSIVPSTRKQYTSASEQQWYQYCDKNINAKFYKTTRFSLLQYLTFSFNVGDSYGSLNTHKSAI